jgi:hypothetical protein
MLNAAAGGGAKHSPTDKAMLKCGEVGSYSKLNKKKAKRNKKEKAKFERDHVPAKATLKAAALRRAGKVTKKQRKCIAAKVERDGICIAIPRTMHRKYSRTCGSKNKKLIKTDSKSKEAMADAVEKDLQDMEAAMKGTPCEAKYKEAADKVRKHDNDKVIKDAIAACT